MHIYFSLQRSSTFPSWCRADFHGLAVQQTIVIPQLQFLNEVIDVPVVPSRSHACSVQRQVPSTVAVHQQGRLPPFRGAVVDSNGLTVQADHRDSPFAVHMVVDVPVVLVMQIPCRGAEADSHGTHCRRTIEIPQFFDKVFVVPVVPWRRQSRSHGCTR